jgi:succinate dehydrogenase / fumarate reductase cytochrome b subunit
MGAPLRVFQSSVGTKILIGLSGFLLFLYLIIHVTGNTLVLVGPEAFNGFHEFMTSNPLLPAIEVALLLVFLLHIFKTIGMFLANRQARPVAYQVKKPAGPPSRKSLASTTMIVGGLWLVAFLLIHVRTFRFPNGYQTADGHLDLYALEMDTLASPLTAAFYVLSMLVIGSHLWHGVSSAFQSLGADHPSWTPRILVFGRVASVAIAGMFIVITLWVFFVGARP